MNSRVFLLAVAPLTRLATRGSAPPVAVIMLADAVKAWTHAGKSRACLGKLAICRRGSPSRPVTWLLVIGPNRLDRIQDPLPRPLELKIGPATVSCVKRTVGCFDTDFCFNYNTKAHARRAHMNVNIAVGVGNRVGVDSFHPWLRRPAGHTGSLRSQSANCKGISPNPPSTFGPLQLKRFNLARRAAVRQLNIKVRPNPAKLHEARRRRGGNPFGQLDYHVHARTRFADVNYNVAVGVGGHVCDDAVDGELRRPLGRLAILRASQVKRKTRKPPPRGPGSLWARPEVLSLPTQP